MAKFVLAGEEFPLLSTEDLLFAEARAIQKATGLTLGQLMESEGDVNAVQGLMWVSMKRSRPEMKFSDLDAVPMASVDWVEDEPEGDAAPDPTQGENSPTSD